MKFISILLLLISSGPLCAQLDFDNQDSSNHALITQLIAKVDKGDYENITSIWLRR